MLYLSISLTLMFFNLEITFYNLIFSFKVILRSIFVFLRQRVFDCFDLSMVIIKEFFRDLSGEFVTNTVGYEIIFLWRNFNA